MKENISLMLRECHQEPVNRNDRFWMDVVESLSSSLRREGCPSFVVSWIKEVLNLLQDLNIVLVMPQDGCWGIYIKGKDDYLFSCNDGRSHVYISKRLFANFKKKKEFKLVAGILLHEITELILCQKAKRKGREPDLSKIHGEASRIEREFLGKEISPERVFGEFVELEKDRSNVVVDNKDVFVEGCAVSGEEIVAEISSVRDPEESFIAELAPGERKRFTYSGGVFAVDARPFGIPFVLEEIDFKDYCNLMKIMDNFFVEENVLDGAFRELLVYIRNLNYFEEYDNLLLKLLWLFVEKFWSNRVSRREFLYNLFLIIDEYISYFELLELIKTKYWKHSRFVKDYVNEIVSQVYDKKKVVLENKKENIARMWNNAVGWFSRMTESPRFPEINAWPCMEKLPRSIMKLYKKPKGISAISRYDKDITAELSLHKDILGIMKMIGTLKDEFRAYNGVKRQKDSKICELLMIRTHFWNGQSLFSRGERIGIYTLQKKGAGLIEVLDITDSSMIVSLTSYDSTIPEAGFVKRLEEQDESLIVQIEAIDTVTRGEVVAEKVLKMEVSAEEGEPLKDISCFNPMIKGDKSQVEAVSKALSRDMITLIQGPPGTGKTTVIAEIVLQYLREGKRILLSSQTHNAVDNALENVMGYKIPQMGIGRVASREEKIVDHKIKGIWIKGKRELDQFEATYRQGLVIGATNVGTHTLSLMKERKFDVLVMDEAGKSNIVESILPMLLLAPKGKLIIVGDHMQGMPFGYDERIVNLFMEREGLKDTKRAISLKERLNQSLFEWLVKEGCQSVMLKVNYRSEPQIVELVSKLFYKGMLLPAKLPSRKAKSIVVVDTSKLAPIEKRKETEEAEGRGYKNTYEAELVLQEIKELLRRRYIATGIKTRYITGVTILTPYLFQVEEIGRVLSSGLSRYLSRAAINEFIGNITTIDSFQGRENEIVIISFTRSNANPAEVGFLNELNRINVALSRARKKMILIGDFHTLRNTRRDPRAKFTRGIFNAIYRFR